ncbi:hypothetical protein ACHAXT_010879 [Thalassiosira profunda]
MAAERDRDEEHRAVFGEDLVIDEDGSDYDSDDADFCAHEKHVAKFGFPNSLTKVINRIKNNDPTIKKVSKYDHLVGIDGFSDLAWKLFGRYVGANTNITVINLSHLGLTDEKMSFLFKELTKSSSLIVMELSYNRFGSEGIRSMTPFLQNAPNLIRLRLDNRDNTTFDSESFEWLISALDGGPLKVLELDGCENLRDVTALSQFFLPQLVKLHLGSNNICIIPSFEDYTQLVELNLSHNELGADGCRSIAKLLKNKKSSLRQLYLRANQVGDEEAEILAESLQQNTSLINLQLENVVGFNKLREAGCKAFLKLLNDISSVEGTGKSNHSLTQLGLPSLGYRNETKEIRDIKILIDGALSINKRHKGKSHEAAREKIIESQMHTMRRKEFCRLQGVNFDYANLLEGIDDIYAPDVLAMASEMRDSAPYDTILYSMTYFERGGIPFTELYRMLKNLVPALTSLIDRKGLLEDTLEKNRAQMAANAAEYNMQTKIYSLQTAHFVSKNGALAAANFALNKRLLSMGSGKGPVEDISTVARKTNKRRRSASF